MKTKNPPNHKHDFGEIVKGKAFKDMKCSCRMNFYDYMTPKLKALRDELDIIASDLEFIARDGKLKRTVSHLTPENLLRHFNI